METQLGQSFTGAPQWATKVNSSFLGLTATGCIYSWNTEQSLHIPFLLLARTFQANRGEENLSTVTKCRKINSWHKININSYFETYSSFNCHCGRVSCLLADEQSLSYSSLNCHSKSMSWQTSDLEASELNANSHSCTRAPRCNVYWAERTFHQPVYTVKKTFCRTNTPHRNSPFLCLWQATSSKAAWCSPGDMRSVLLKSSTLCFPSPSLPSELPCSRWPAPTAGVLCSQCCYFETAWLRWLGVSSVG